MKNKRRNTIITLIVVSLIIIAGIVFFSLNYSTSDSSFTILEKKWITDHTNKIVDVQVYNDIPVYGYNGNGIIFDFLDYFTEKNKIQFNKISYYTDSKIEPGGLAFLILDNTEDVTNKDLLLYEDHYVILAKDQTAHLDLNQVTSLGVLKADSKLIKEYLNPEIKYLEYENVEELVTGLQNKEVANIVLPSLTSMDEILKNNLNIVYHVEDLQKKYVLRAKDNETYSIMKKAYNEYLKKNYQEDYSKNYLNIYFDSTNTNDLSKKNYNAKNYKYGYVINMPYENYVGKEFVGTLFNYLNTFEQVADIEIEAVQYQTIDDLKNALVSGEVDFAFGNFAYENINLENVQTTPVADLEYLVLSKQEIPLNSLKGLSNNKVSTVASSLLFQLCKKNNLETNNYKDTNDLLRNIDDNSIILLDKQTYHYYHDSKLKDYKIIYEDKVKNAYKFIMNAQNNTFNSLFNYYISTIDYNTVKYQYHTSVSLEKDYTTIKIVCFIVALILFLTCSIILISRKNVTNTTMSKEDKLKYIDPMTSLKNRSYLNRNIYKWDDNVIFPQSVIVFDLNNIKQINDKLGREAGDEIIKKVASILINNQLENTDIIRSGGDEFLIYMVGYEEKKVADYSKKLLKEMKEIPNSMGVEVGYSMILDEVKTVDDAINESILMMTKNKEKRNKD